MEIYEALKRDHDNVKALLNRLVSLSDDANKERESLVAQIRDELVPHSRAEEAVFYNSLRLLDDSKVLAMHGYQEHLESETLLRALQVASSVGTGWREAAERLQKSLVHHIEEEEGEIFSAAKQVFTREEAVVLNEAFQEMKPRVQEEGFMANTVELVKNMMPPRLTDALSDIQARFTGSDKSGTDKHAR